MRSIEKSGKAVNEELSSHYNNDGWEVVDLSAAVVRYPSMCLLSSLGVRYCLDID